MQVADAPAVGSAHHDQRSPRHALRVVQQESHERRVRPQALDQARIKRDFVGAHNGLMTVVWEQEVEGIPVFEGVLISLQHTAGTGVTPTTASSSSTGVGEVPLFGVLSRSA